MTPCDLKFDLIKKLIKCFCRTCHSLSNAVYRLSLSFLVFEFSGGGAVIHPQAVRRWLRPPPGRGLMMTKDEVNRARRKTSAAELKRTVNDVTSPKHKTSNISRSTQYFWEKSYTHVKWNVLNILTYNLSIFDNFLQGGIVPLNA